MSRLSLLLGPAADRGYAASPLRPQPLSTRPNEECMPSITSFPLVKGGAVKPKGALVCMF